MRKLIGFWQELKRRNVVRRNTVYAATAFVILELFSNIADPLKLPEWTLPLVIILLSIGFVVSVILSWSYDFTSEGNFEETKSPRLIEKEENPLPDSNWKIASYISFAVIVGLIVLNIIPRRKSLNEINELDKSIAVLPFQNLSSDSTQVYFCEAMREEILTHIEKVKDFSVRSRTSTDHYRNTTKNSVLIGQELKVNYLVEGSVSLIGNEMKIWLQMINAQNDEPIWSDVFIREKKQIFDLQTEIAKALAAELRTNLSPEEIGDIEAKPTENSEAYHAYMRGRFYTNQPHDDISHWSQALKSFKEAVELDSTFALAYAGLAKTYAVHYNLKYDYSDSCLENASRAAKKALELGNDLPEVHLQIGYYYFLAFRDKKNRDKHWKIASEGMPDNADMIRAKFGSMKTEGRWKEALEMLEKAVEKNPNISDFYSDLGMSAWFLREYERSDDAYNMALSLNPQGPFPYVGKSFNMFSWKGVNDESEEFYKKAQGQHWYHYLEFWNIVGKGNYQEALQLVKDSVSGWLCHNPVYVIPHSLFRAYIYLHLGKNNLAEQNFRLTKDLLEKMVKEKPNDSRYHSTLGIVYAALGMKQEALIEMDEAHQLLPLEQDAVYGTSPLFDAVLIKFFNGDLEEALDQMEFISSFPSPYSIHYLDWYLPLMPLKKHPKYAQLKNKFDRAI